MKLAFCLFKYFPYGGLQQDFIRIAQLCQQRGHSIDIYAIQWEGHVPPGFNLKLLPVSGFSNHRRDISFAQQLGQVLQKIPYDKVIGFNRMPHLDIYIAADPCYQALIKRERNVFYQYTSRYRHYLALEKAIFSPSAHTRILTLTAAEREKFMHYYGTQSHRFYLLPPGISKKFRASDSTAVRNSIRDILKIGHEQNLILMIASFFKTKGVDRALHALASLPPALLDNTHLVIIGQDRQKPFLKLARQLKIIDRLQFLGACDDVVPFLWSADLLLHPAYLEAGGKVLLEAVATGLPVLATSHCGYAPHIKKAQSGLLLSHPFSQNELNSCLHHMLTSPQRDHWKKNALHYAANTDLHSLHETVVAIIEQREPFFPYKTPVSP